MKVFEIFMTPNQLKYQSIDEPIDDRWERLRATPRGRSRVGTGAFASVYASEKDPGSVEKVASPLMISSLSNDGYYQFLDAIAHNDRISKNPFFPKIYKLQTFRDKEGKYTYSVNMEQLHALKTLSSEEAIRIGRELFTNFDGVFKAVRKEQNVQGSRPSRNPEADENKIRLQHLVTIMTLARCFNDAIQADTVTHVTNTHLKQAIMLIHKIMKSSEDRAPDLHTGNLMVRRGPFAPQIVITDPIT